MFRDPTQLKVHELADQLALALVQGLSAQPLSPIGCTLASAAIRPALRIQEACRKPGNAGFAEGLAKASEAALELHYLCTLGSRANLLPTTTQDQALHLVKALLRLRKIQRERTVNPAPAEIPPLAG
jgi:hypothetical protein